MARSNARLEVSGAGKTEDGLVQYNEEVNKLGDDLRELYETIRVNVDEEEQWKVFDFVEDFFMEELEIGDYINDINSYHLHMFDKHDVTTKKFDAIVEKAGKVDANYAAQIEGYCGLLGEYGKKFEAVCAMLALDLIGVIPVIGALKYSDEIGTLFKNADKVSVVARSTDGTGVLAKHADEAGAWLHGVKVFRYLDETAEAVASGEKLLKESETIYESFADMMSSEDAKRYLDFLENGSREGLTGAELAGVEKADALLVSQKVGYEDVWDLRNAGDVLETSYGKSSGKYDTTADFLTNIENRNGKFYTDKATIDKIGQVEARGEDFSLLNKRIMSSRASTEGGTSVVYKYSDELGTKYLIHEVTDARGYIIHRDFDAVRISSGQLINKGH